jgi:hypothetical protein
LSGPARIFSPLILEHLAASYAWAAKLHQQVLPLQTYFTHFKIPAIIAAVFSLAGLFVVWSARRRENIREYYIWTIAAFASLVCALIISQVYLFENKYSAKNIIADLRAKYPKDEIRLYMYTDFEEISTTPYYLGRPAVIINWNSNDLWYGMSKEDSKPYKITIEDFLKLPAGQPIFVLMEKRRISDFKRKTPGSGFKVWKDYGKRIVFYKEKQRK